MTVAAGVPRAVPKYLEELELALKSQPGVSPEEALSDAREFLINDVEALARCGEGPDDDAALYQRFVATFGLPADVARQYAEQALPVSQRPAYAPGWRICCTKCGRSAPLAHVGWTRIGARSRHKYTLGFCRDCRRLRFLRIIRDLDTANLSARLGATRTPDELRSRMHRPWLVLFVILLSVAALVAAGLALAGRAAGQDREANRVALDRVRLALERDYSYRDRLGVNWSKRCDEYQAKLLEAKNSDDFARALAEVLGAAKDVHIWLKIGDRIIGTHQPDLRPNFNPRVLPRLLAQYKQHGKTVLVGNFADGIRYVAIGTWEEREPASLDAALAAVKDAAQAQAPLIIDVRPNSGGKEVRAQQLAAVFVDKATVYAGHRLRVKGKDGPAQSRVLQPDAAGLRHPGPCVVLMGPANISSCESFLLMMRAAGQTLIGAPSLGHSGSPQPHDLGNGVVVWLPSWRSLGADGRDLEGVGIMPDITVAAQPADFAMADPVLARALEHLRAKK
jgi:hypothetical protein